MENANQTVVTTPDILSTATITAAQDVAATTQPTQVTETPPVKKEVFFAGRKFDSEADALAYASAMQTTPTTTATTTVVDDVTPDKILFEDPASALRLHEEQIIRKIEQKYTAVEQQKKTWEGFYDKNKDLKGYESVVDGILATRPDIQKMPIEQALTTLAVESRSVMARIRGTTTTTERLNSNGATTAVPSAAPGFTTVVHKTAPTTFADEIKALRAKRQKVV